MDCMALSKWIRWLYFHGLGGSATVEYSGIIESKNGIAKEIKNNAKGYKNFLRYRNRCLYCMNKTTKPNYAGSHKSIRMKGWPRGRYKKNK